VTDVHVVLGRIGARDLLGGEFPIDAGRSASAVEALARRLRLDVRRTAQGVIEVVEATMEGALRAISLGKGRDPRRFALYAFGGAGGLHACSLAQKLGIRRVVVPPSPGTFSATGLASAPLGVEVSMTRMTSPESPSVAAGFEALERRATARLRSQGVDRASLRIARFVDMRYAGQSHEIRVRFGPGAARAFTRAHRRLYGHVREGRPIEVVALRVRATAREGEARSSAFGPSSTLRLDETRGAERAEARSAARAPARKTGDVPSLPRESIAGMRLLRGPARITEYSGTTYVPAGWICRPGPCGALVLTPRRRAAPGSR
jgi:N-methylhydantoinase A